MSQTSATPGLEAQSQYSNPGFYQVMGAEIDRLTSELERAHAQEARSRLSAQEWQTRAEEAEHRADEAEHRADEAERELSRIQGSQAESNKVWRDMGQAYANVTGQSQDLNPAGQGEREAHSRRPGPEQDIIMTGDANTPGSDRPSMRRSRGGSQSNENSLTPHDNALPGLGSNLHHGSSTGRSSLSSRPGLKRKFEPAVGDPEGPSLRRRPPPPLTHPRESPTHQPSCAVTTGPSDRNAGPSHVARWGTDLTNRPEYHANMQEDIPAVSKASRLARGNSHQMPENPSQILGIPTESTAPPLEKRATPVPRIHMAPWDFQGPIEKPKTVASFFRELVGYSLSDTESNEGGQGLRFEDWQYDGRGGHGGNQNDEVGEDVNHGTRQDHART